MNPMTQFPLTPTKATPLLVCYRGSLSHGTYIPSEEKDSIDDIDLMAFYIGELKDYFGVQHAPRGLDVKVGEFDWALYELRHAVQLLSQANPNILSSLWMKDYLVLTPPGQQLVDNRQLFLTQEAGFSFSGYARAQLKRMTSISEAVEECCAGEKFHLPECPLNTSRGRGSQKKFGTGFMGDKRKQLVKQHGYDVKNAAHLVRLLRMGIEVVRDGEVRVDRRGVDAEELIDIKKGKWSLQEVKSLSDQLFGEFEIAKEKSTLPLKPDMEKLNQLLVDLLWGYWKNEKLD